MTASPMPEQRRSGTYSLDDTARLWKMLLMKSMVVECPKCWAAMERTGGTDRDGSVWFLRCRRCGRGVVIRALASESDPS